MGRIEALRATLSYQDGDAAAAQPSIERALLLGGNSSDVTGEVPPEAAELGWPAPEYRCLETVLRSRFPSAPRSRADVDFWARMHALAYRASLASDARSTAEGRVSRTLRQILSHAARPPIEVSSADDPAWSAYAEMLTDTGVSPD